MMPFLMSFILAAAAGTAGEAPAKPAKPKKICEKIEVTGSTVGKRVCRIVPAEKNDDVSATAETGKTATDGG